MLDQLSPDEKTMLDTKFGAGWCQCLQHSIAQVTPDMLDAYCKHRKFREWAKVENDGNGRRFSYFLRIVTIIDPETQKPKDVNVVASFFDFHAFPRANAEGIADSIRRIAQMDHRRPDEIAAEIIALSQPKAPAKTTRTRKK